jgi:alpha-beta hydrolase superfamily lysophospholipase
MLKNTIRKLLVITGFLVLLYCGAALTMVFWPVPKFAHPFAFSTQTATQTHTVAPATPNAEAIQFHMRDGAVLRAAKFGQNAPETILFLHGVLASSDQYLETCSQLHILTGDKVIALDLRGHGKSDGVPGDIRYIGQYEDDVADVLKQITDKQPGSRIILAGHSMGGGIVMRYAALHLKPAADGYLLFAPHLGIKSPTMRLGPAPGSVTVGEPLTKLDLPRVLGLVMLNPIGMRWFNGLDTLFFNVPAQFPIHAYSFRAMVSMTPDSHIAALTADRTPLLVIVGSKDEVFYADRFASVISLHQNSKTVLVDGPTHDGIVHSAAALSAAADWIRQTRQPIRLAVVAL